MKPDVLTFAIAIFVIGVLASGLGITDVFQSEPTPVVADFQQGGAPISTNPSRNSQ